MQAERSVELIGTNRTCGLAYSLLGRHTLLKAFLEKLGVPEKVADRDACLMEHILSATTLDRIRAFVEEPAKTATAKKKETK